METKMSWVSPSTSTLVVVLPSSNEINGKVHPIKDLMMLLENISTNIIIGMTTNKRVTLMKPLDHSLLLLEERCMCMCDCIYCTCACVYESLTVKIILQHYRYE